MALVRVFPNFVAVNREGPNLTGLEYAPAARCYLDNQGPDVVGEYVPWVIDIIPTARWVQLVFAFSLLFGAQAVWHRFRLWRLDACRVQIEGEVTRLFAPGTTVVEIAESLPEPRHRTPAARAQVDTTMSELGELAERCRRQSLSILVPMGQEMNYRYQERLIADLLHALRHFAHGSTASSLTPQIAVRSTLEPSLTLAPAAPARCPLAGTSRDIAVDLLGVGRVVRVENWNVGHGAHSSPPTTYRPYLTRARWVTRRVTSAPPLADSSNESYKINYLSYIHWRRRRDSNPGYRFWPVCSLSRGVPSTTRPRLRNLRIVSRAAPGRARA